MDKKSISKVLKYYRKSNQYKVSEVAILLSGDGKHIAEKTIYGWESGKTMPDAESLIKLCDLYNIRDIKYAFGYCNRLDSLNLSTHELVLIKQYRNNSELQYVVDRILDI